MAGISPTISIWERISAVTDFTDACWLWNGQRESDGYGTIRYHGKTVKAHRLVAELLGINVPPISTGLETDHLCRVRNCVNPDHMEYVTHAENMRRTIGFYQKAHCPQGHPMSGENVRTHKRGYRICLTCNRKAWREYASRKRAERRKQAIDIASPTAG